MASPLKIFPQSKTSISDFLKHWGKSTSDLNVDDGETFEVLFGYGSEASSSSKPVWTSARSAHSINRPPCSVQASPSCGSSICGQPRLEKTAPRCASVELPPLEISKPDADITLERSQSWSRRSSFDKEPPSNVIDALNRRFTELTRRLEKVEEDCMFKADMRLRMLEARTGTLEETFMMELRLKALEEQTSFFPEASSQSPANRRESSPTVENRLAFLEACCHDLHRGSPWNRSLETVTDLIAEVAAKQCKIEECLFVLNSNGRLPVIRSTKMKDDTADEHSERYNIFCPFGPTMVAKEMRIPVQRTSLVAEAMGTSQAFSSRESTVESSILNDDIESSLLSGVFDVDQLYLSTCTASASETLFGE